MATIERETGTMGTGSATPSPSVTPVRRNSEPRPWSSSKPAPFVSDPSLGGGRSTVQPIARTGAAAPATTPVDPVAPTRPPVAPTAVDTALDKATRTKFGGGNLNTTLASRKILFGGAAQWNIPKSTKATKLLNYASVYGQPSLKSQFMGANGKMSGKAALLTGSMMLAQTFLGTEDGKVVDEATNSTLIEDRTAAFQYMGYPPEVAKTMATDENFLQNAYGAVSGLGAAVVADAAVGATGAVIGGTIGTFFMPGIGTAAGASLGWAAGTTISGISTLINMFVEPFTKGIFGIDIPTLDDFWGVKDIYQMSGEAAYTAANTMVESTIQSRFPGRFRSQGETLNELDRMQTGYYATSAEVDPRAGEMTDLVSKGYFIKTKADGTRGIDVEAYQKYKQESMLYKFDIDKEKFLPKTKGDAKEITQEDWFALWNNAE